MLGWIQMNFYGWVLCVVSLQKEECPRLRKVVKWTYLCTLTSEEAVSFALFEELLLQTKKK